MISDLNVFFTTLNHWLLARTLPRSIMFRYSRWVMGLLFISGDLLALAISAAAPIFIWKQFNPDLLVHNYIQLYPLLGLFIALYFISGLYPAMGLNSSDLLQRQILATTIGYLILGTAIFYFRNALEWSRGTFAVSWALSLFIIPNIRIFIRQIASHLNFWGEPVAIIGYGEVGKRIAENLKKQPSLGFQPIVAFEGRSSSFQDLANPGATTIKALSYPSYIGQIQTAILVLDEISPELLNLILYQETFRFPRKILVSSSQSEYHSGAVFQLGGVFGAEIRQNLKSTWQPVAKRIFDLSMVILTSPFWLSLFCLIALLIYLDNRGKIFFSQKRIGKGGKTFPVFKFRTMIENAPDVLEDHFRNNPEMEKEWKQNYKLKNDPRVTHVGLFLRRYSLDEFPQIINVIRGEMSLVGPRPIVKEEAVFYGAKFANIKLVLPGMTGLWQISGRNNLTYQERVNLDDFYVRNWSIWLDFDILLKTIWVIFRGDGAY